MEISKLYIFKFVIILLNFRFEGQWEGGEKNGKGLFIFANGDR